MIEWKRPMALLLYILLSSAESELSSADSKLFSTLIGLSFNHLENRSTENGENGCGIRFFIYHRSASPMLFPQVYFPKKEIVKAYHQYAFFVIAREEPITSNDYFSEPISNMK